MSTGQFPKRRENDAQARRRVDGILERRKERGLGPNQPQPVLLPRELHPNLDLTRLGR